MLSIPMNTISTIDLDECYRPSIFNCTSFPQALEICRLLKQRIHEKLRKSRHKLFVLFNSDHPSRPVFPQLPVSVIIEHILGFTTHFEVITVMPLVSRQMACIATCDAVCTHLVRCLHIHPSKTLPPNWRRVKPFWGKINYIKDTASEKDIKEWEEAFEKDTKESSKSSPSRHQLINTLERRQSTIHGTCTGTFATRVIHPGSPMTFVTGEYETPSKLYEDDNNHAFYCSGKQGFNSTQCVLTPFGRHGKDNRSMIHFANHSCQPNARVLRFDIASNLNTAYIPHRDDSTWGDLEDTCTPKGFISWMSDNDLLRSVWVSFCLPLLRYKTRGEQQEDEDEDEDEDEEKCTQDHLFLLCARGCLIPKNAEVTITHSKYLIISTT